MLPIITLVLIYFLLFSVTSARNNDSLRAEAANNEQLSNSPEAVKKMINNMRKDIQAAMSEMKPTSVLCAIKQKYNKLFYAKIADENSEMKAAYMMAYVSTKSTNSWYCNEVIDSNIIDQIPKVIATDSPLWSLLICSPIQLLSVAGESAVPYIEKICSEHPDSNVRKDAVEGLIEWFSLQNDSRISTYISLLTQNYASDKYIKYKIYRFDPNRAIKKGKLVPNFRLMDIFDSTLFYTPSYFKGKLILIDIWATWCSPCLQQIAVLDSLYKKYKDRNFEILSISLDVSLQTVRNFKNSSQAIMPWHHSYSEGVLDSEVASMFEVGIVPTLVLIAPDGTIIADNLDIQHQGLEKIIERFFSD